MNIAVLGAGGWGTTLSILLYRNGHKVTLWEFNPEYAETLKEYRENFYFLPKIKIPEGIEISNDLEKSVFSKDIVLISTPTQFIRESLKELAQFDFRDKIIVSASKGIEMKTHFLVSEIVEDIFKKVNRRTITCLSGPSHAEEVSRKIPTAILAASEDIKTAQKIQNEFSNSHFRVYASRDLRGTEIGGALKNVIAIAAGMADGAGFGDNTKAAIMTRGMSEIMRLGLKLGAKMETFFGLSGIGDLIVTCDSKHSRNRYVGEQIGKGRTLTSVLKEMKMVAEGVSTTKSAFELSKRMKVELPIVNEVNSILFEEKNPRKSTLELMTRSLKEEHTI